MFPLETIVIAVLSFAGLVILAATALRGWNGWLELKRLELERVGPHAAPTAGGMIELSDVKERLRKLEAIAAGVDL